MTIQAVRAKLFPTSPAKITTTKSLLTIAVVTSGVVANIFRGSAKVYPQLSHKEEAALTQ